MSDEAPKLVQRAAGLLHQKPPPDHGDGVFDKNWESDAVVDPRPFATLDNEEVSPAGIFRVAWRYKFTLIGTTLLLIALAAAVILPMPAIYAPEALVVVGNREASLPQLRTGAGAYPPLADTATVQTEMEILGSRTLAAQVVDDLKLWKRPEFNPNIPSNEKPGALQQSLEAFSTCALSPLSCLRELPGRFFPGESPATAGDQNAHTTKDIAVESFLGKLNVSVKTNSRVISVQFQDHDPKLATLAVNSLVDHYIANHLVTTNADANQATRWLDQTLTELRKRADQSEQAYQQFRATFEASGDTRDLLDRKMTETSLQLEAAETARDEAETRLISLKALLGKDVADLATSDVAASPVMQELRKKSAELHEQLAQLTTILGDNHPKVRNLKAAIARSNQEMQAEVGRLVTSLEANVRLATAKEDSLKEILAKTQGEIARSSDGEEKLEDLKADAASNRAALEAFQRQKIEAIGVSAAPPERIDAEIVAHASVPQGPAKPKKTLLLMIAAAGSVMAGFGAAFAREKHDQTFRSGQEVEVEIGDRPLAFIPLSQKRKSPQDEILGSSSSFYAETIRTLYMTLLLRQRFKIVVITSARQNEGKTTLAASLALIAAKAGKKALLVDADLCTGGASRNFGAVGHEGLADLISGGKQLSEVVGRFGPIAAADLHFLSCGTQENLLAARSALENTLGLFRRLRDEYDLIIVDTPPILAVSDAMALSTQADATLFVVRWGTTSRAAVRLGLRRLLASGYSRTVTGIVLTMVNARELSRYGYEDSVLHAKDLVNYHSSTKGKSPRISLAAR